MPAPVIRTIGFAIVAPLTASRRRNSARASGRHRCARQARRGTPRSRRRLRARRNGRAATPPAWRSATPRTARDQLGIDRSGRDGVDPHTAPAHLAGKRLGKADDAGLGGAVVRELDPADLAELRGDIDNHPFPCGEHRSDRAAGAEEGAAEMDSDHAVELGRRQFLEGRLVDEAGIVDEQRAGPKAAHASNIALTECSSLTST